MNLAVVYGGVSCEKDISVITALQAMNTLKSKYKIVPLFLDKDGFWLFEKADNIDTYLDKSAKKTKVFLMGKSVYKKNLIGLKKISDIDCCLLCTHGGNGENGVLQGFLKLNDIPFTCSDVFASCVGMDKALSKLLFSNLNLNVLPYKVYYDNIPCDYIVEDVEGSLGFPVVVKPCSQGSSIGIDIAENPDQLKNAVEVAFEFDSKIVIEKALTDFCEINCAVVKNKDDFIVSDLEQPLSWQKILTFEEKYLNSGGKMSECGRIYPAKLPSDIADLIKDTALKAYIGLQAKGVVRIDFLVDNSDNTVYINEANTIPGSLATYLFETLALSYADIVDIMIQTALYEQNNKKAVDFGSNVLNIYGKCCANACKLNGKLL